MADRDSERDRRVRELLSEKSKKKDGFSVIGQSQAEIQDIQSELQNHLAMQQMQDQNRLQQTQTISQAAEGMMAMEGGDGLQGQVAQMNPGTQAVMGKYGVKPGRTQDTQRSGTSRTTQSTAGSTTNIKTENITNNRTEIKVTQPNIPVSQPQIAMAAPKKEDNTSKFKAWLSGMFAKQSNEAEIQKKEYRKKEWNLGRTASKLMKRIESATSGLSARLDPKNMTSTLGGQLKWLLLIFGATMMAKVWKPTMKFLANLEGGFRAVFGLPINDDLRNASSSTLSVIDQIRGFIGIKQGEKTTLIEGIGKVFMEGIDKLIDKLKFWFEDRADAIKDVTFPEIKMSSIGIPILDGLLDGLSSTFKGVAQYLGDIITVAMGGSKGKVKVEANRVADRAKEVFTNTAGKQTSVGDEALLKGKGRSYMRESDYDMFGNLKGGASSTQAMSESLISLFNDRSGKAHTAEIGTGVSQLFGVAKREGQVVIDPELLQYLGLTQADIVALQRNKQLAQKRYRIIAVHPTDQDLKEGNNYTSWNRVGAGLTGAAISAYAGMKAGAAGGGAIGGFFGGAGAAPGAVIGGGLGALTGAAVGYLGGYGVGSGIDAYINSIKKKGLIPKIVPGDSNQMGADGSKGVPKMMWVLSKEGADAVTAKFTARMSNKDMDLTNREFYNKLRAIEERKKRQNGVKGAITQNLDTNDLNVAQAQYDAYNKEYYNRFESNDPNSWNMQHYGHFNSAWDNAANVMGNIGSYAASGLRAVGNFITSERLSGKQATSRSNYLIQKLMQKGLTKEQAAGVAGNIMRESGFVTNKWGDHGTSVGIAQWHGERIRQYNTAYGAQGNLADASFEQQVDYLIWEAEENGTMGKMRQTRSIAEATNTWERLFEGSADYKSNGNRYRIEYAAKALNSFNDSSGGVDMGALQTQNTSMATFYKGQSPFQIEGEKSTVGGSNIIAWIGDSHSETGLPDVVGGRLKSKFGCQYVWGAYHGYSANSHLKNKPYNGICSRDNKVANLSGILEKKPSIVIVQLGANDANGVDGPWATGIPKLIDTLKGNGSKVVWLTPFGYSVGAKTAKRNAMEMNKRANQVREYILSRSDISVVDVGGFVNFYSGQATPWDKFVGQDGLHWNRKGYQMLGDWIGGVLTGVVSNPNFTSEDLEKQDGLFGAISDNVGGYIEGLADKVENIGKSDEGEKKFSLTNNMTDKQKKILNQLQSYNAWTGVVNEASFENAGAKVDNTGTYFEVEGGYRAYVDPNNSNALLGLDENDIQMVAKYNPKTKKIESVSPDEVDLIKKSVSTNVTSLFSEYDGKGGTNDVMKSAKGGSQKFYLGSFSDIGAFHKTAQSSFKKHRGGKITYWVYPTKDRSRYSLVEILPVAANFIDLSKNKGGNDTTIGPIIYNQGKKWHRLGTLPSENKLTGGWQPIADFFNVRFTPEASKALRKLFVLLGYGKLTAKNGKIYNEKGEELKGDDLQNAIRFGLVQNNVQTTPGGGSYSYLSVSDDYNKAQETAESTFKDKKFNSSSYFGSLHIGDKQKDKEDYYKKNQNQFHLMNGKIYGPGGVEWGTYDEKDKSKFTLYDEETLKKVAEKSGADGLKNNLAEVKRDKSRQYSLDLGIVDRNDVGELVSKSMSTDKITEKEQEQISKRTKFNYGLSKHTEIAGSPIDYFVYYNESGEPIKFKVNSKQFGNFYKDLTGEEDPTVINTIESKSEEELLKKVIATAAHHKAQNTEKKGWIFKEKMTQKDKNALEKQLVKDYTEQTGFKTHTYGDASNHYTSHGYHRNSEIDKLISYLISNRKRLAKEVVYYEDMSGGDIHQEISYEDGSSEQTTFFIPEDAGQKIMSFVNSRIDKANKEAFKQRFINNYEGSGLQKSYQGLIDRVKKGDINATYDNGQVLTNAGDVIGTYTENEKGEKEIKALTAEQAHDNAISYMDNKATKAKFYQQKFGAVWENDGLYIYNAQGTARAKIDLNKSISEVKSIADIINRKTIQARESKTSSWDLISKVGDASFDAKTGVYHNDKLFGGQSNDQVTNSIISSFDHMGQTMDLNKDIMDSMLDELSEQTDQGLTAEKRRILQIKHEKDTAASTTQTAKLFQAWADNGFQTSSDPAMLDAIKNIKIEATNTRNSAIQEALQSSAAYKNVKFHVIKDANGIERYFDLNKNGHAYEMSIGADGSINKTDRGAYKYGANGGLGISGWAGQNNPCLIDARSFNGGTTINNNNSGGGGDVTTSGSSGTGQR